MTNYKLLAQTIADKFENDHVPMSTETCLNVIKRRQELNAATVPTITELQTFKLQGDMASIVALVAEMDSANTQRKTQIKYQLKNYFHFDLKTLVYTGNK